MGLVEKVIGAQETEGDQLFAVVGETLEVDVVDVVVEVGFVTAVEDGFYKFHENLNNNKKHIICCLKKLPTLCCPFILAVFTYYITTFCIVSDLPSPNKILVIKKKKSFSD